MENNVLVQDAIQRRDWYVHRMEMQKYVNVHQEIGFGLITLNAVWK